MSDLLTKSIKNGNSGTILANLFRCILFDLGINTQRFNILIERYMKISNVPSNLRETSTIRGNLKKELLKPSISWKVFVKGLVFLNISKFDISIKLYHHNGTYTQHTKTIVLDVNTLEDLKNE